MRFFDAAAVAAALPFETLAETTVLPISAEACYKRPLDEADSARMAELIIGCAFIRVG